MTTLIIIAAVLFVLSVFGVSHATSKNYPSDAAPAGAIILALSILAGAVSIMLLSIALGIYIGGALR